MKKEKVKIVQFDFHGKCNHIEIVAWNEKEFSVRKYENITCNRCLLRKDDDQR